MEEKETNILLRDSIIEKFNYEKTKMNLYKLIDQYFVYELEYHYINPPMITPSYEIRYDSNKDFTPSSKTETYVINKITQEENIREFYKDLYIIYNKLNIDELKYFKQHFLRRKAEYVIMHEMNLNRRCFESIKKSCVIKMAIFFNIAVRK